MMKKTIYILFFAVVVFTSCKKETATIESSTISEYIPLEVGKYITYQLDSFKYRPNSLIGDTRTYQAKYIVDAEITDNLGRPAYRILKLMRKDANEAWRHDNTFAALSNQNVYELTENNLKFTKLTFPIKNGSLWKGNSYINSTSQFTDFAYLRDWDYMYDSIGTTLTVGASTFNDVLKVAQRDEIIGNPEDRSIYSEINYSAEYYAKGIGLVYKNFFHSVYQPPTTPTGTGSYESNSYGLILTMIDHN